MRKAFSKNIAELPFEEAHGGSGRRQLVLSQADAVSSQFEALANTVLETGHVFDWHKHEGVDEFFIVQGGQGVVSFEDGTSIAYGAGSVVYMPADSAHKIEAQGPEASRFFFVRLKQ